MPATLCCKSHDNRIYSPSYSHDIPMIFPILEIFLIIFPMGYFHDHRIFPCFSPIFPSPWPLRGSSVGGELARGHRTGPSVGVLRSQAAPDVGEPGACSFFRYNMQSYLIYMWYIYIWLYIYDYIFIYMIIYLYIWMSIYHIYIYEYIYDYI